MATRGARTEIIHRTCPLCEAKCGISVEVDRTAGTVATIRGDADDPFSRGYLCPKAYGLKGLQEDPDRLRRPVRRVGSDWRRARAGSRCGRGRGRELRGARQT